MRYWLTALKKPDGSLFGLLARGAGGFDDHGVIADTGDLLIEPGNSFRGVDFTDLRMAAAHPGYFDVDPLAKTGWTEAAREASIETRRANQSKSYEFSGNERAVAEQIKADPEVQAAEHLHDNAITTQALYTDPDGFYRSERLAQTLPIAMSMLNPAAATGEGETPHALLMLGKPGSGKSSALEENIQPTLTRQYTTINCDNVQEHLPGFTPDQAPLYHHEAGDLTELYLLPQAIQARQNLIIDMTGKNPDKIASLASNLKEHGYMVDAHLTQLPTTKALQRSYSRFKSTGRYVPPDYLIDVDDKPNKTFARIKAEGLVDHATIHNTDVPRGEPPIVVSHEDFTKALKAMTGYRVGGVTFDPDEVWEGALARGSAVNPLAKTFSDTEARDAHGKWTAGGAGAKSMSSEQWKALLADSAARVAARKASDAPSSGYNPFSAIKTSASPAFRAQVLQGWQQLPANVQTVLANAGIKLLPVAGVEDATRIGLSTEDYLGGETFRPGSGPFANMCVVYETMRADLTHADGTTSKGDLRVTNPDEVARHELMHALDFSTNDPATAAGSYKLVAQMQITDEAQHPQGSAPERERLGYFLYDEAEPGSLTSEEAFAQLAAEACAPKGYVSKFGLTAVLPESAKAVREFLKQVGK